MKTLAFLLAMPLVLAQTAGVEGRVTSADGAPLAKAEVTVRGMTMIDGKSPKNYVAVTSADGRYSVQGMFPGKYTAGAQLSGYVNTGGPVFDLAEGEFRPDVNLTLPLRPPVETPVERTQRYTPSPGATVSGTVVDADGVPINDASVALMYPVFNQGRNVMLQSSTAITNANGEFRLENVQPGSYYLQAATYRYTHIWGPSEIIGPSARVVDLNTFYPSSADVHGATRIVVDGDRAIAGLRVQMLRTPTFFIRGKYTDTSGRQPAITILDMNSNIRRNGAFRLAEGTFEVRHLPPGQYAIVAAWPAYPTTRALHGYVEVTLTDHDVPDVVIPMAETFDMNGRVSWDDGSGGSPGNIQLEFRSADVGRDAQVRATTDGEGFFRAKDVPPGRYFLRVTAQSAYYLKGVRVGDRDLTHQLLDLRGGEVEIRLSHKTALVKLALPTRPLPDEGIAITIWPVVPDSLGVTSVFYETTLRAQGPNVMRGLAPGEYFAVAWAKVPSRDAVRIPDFLNRFAPLATRFRVGEGEEVEVDPAVIPREASQKAYEEFP